MPFHVRSSMPYKGIYFLKKYDGESLAEKLKGVPRRLELVYSIASLAHSEKEGLFPLLFAVVSSVPNPPFIPIYAAGVEEEAQEKKLGMRDGKIVLCSTFTMKKGGGKKTGGLAVVVFGPRTRRGCL